LEGQARRDQEDSGLHRRREGQDDPHDRARRSQSCKAYGRGEHARLGHRRRAAPHYDRVASEGVF